MGVVYSNIDIEHGRLPTEGDHEVAAEKVLEYLPEVGGVACTLVHGSVTEGRSTLRSDLDVLITYQTEDPADEPEVVRAINGQLKKVEKETFVQVEANLWPVDEPLLARRERMYDLLFSEHLADSLMRGNFIVGEPDELTLCIAESLTGAPSEQLIRVALNYTTYKHGGFTKAPLEYDDDPRVLSAFQRALEFPKSVGRKVEQLEGLPGYGQDYEQYWQALCAAGIPEQTLLALSNLREIDRECTEFINMIDQEGGCPNNAYKSDYGKWLTDRYPRAIGSGILAASGFTHFIAPDCL